MKKFFYREQNNEPVSSLRQQLLGKVWIQVVWSILWRLFIALPLAGTIIYSVYTFETNLECEAKKEIVKNPKSTEEKIVKSECNLNQEPWGIIKVQNVEAFAILVAGIIYILEINKRVGEHTEKIIKTAEVWQHIDLSSESPNSYSRIRSLEFLNNHNESLEELQLVANADLQRIDLTGGNLKRSRFNHVNLRYAKFRGANLRKVDFRDANLSHADFKYADLDNAKLNRANLYNADLRWANLERADLRNANLRMAKLKNVKNLDKAKFKGCLYNRQTEFPTDFPSEKKGEMHLISAGVNLSKLDLKGSKLYKANLNDANLRKADLRKVDLGYANLNNADLRKSDLREANLKGAEVTNAKFDGSLYDEKTELPDKFEPKIHHMHFIYESANLEECDLAGVQFSGINLKDANFKSANLKQAQFKGAELNNADFSDAKLNGADLRNANLSNAKLEGANLDGCLYNKNTKFPLHFNEYDSMYLICTKTDLSNVNLCGYHLKNAELKGANLKNANLTDADLRNANLRNANLRGTNFTDAKLNGVKLRYCLCDEKTIFPDNFEISYHKIYFIVPGANLSFTILNSANLGGANLSNADLCCSNFAGSDFSNAKLDNAKLDNACLYETNLKNASFKNTDLSNTQMNRANLSSANLRNCNLSDADLTDANLRNADFSNANLSNTNFTNANIEGADFTDAQNLTTIQVKSAFYWARAKYSNDFKVLLGLPPQK